MSIFDKVDWEAHWMAYTSYKQTQQIGISKLVHGLYHIKYEAHKLYGEDATCPCCGTLPETISHVFQCGATSNAVHRVEAKEKLSDSLCKIKTPDKLLLVFMHGISSWETLGLEEKPTPLYRGPFVQDDATLV